MRNPRILIVDDHELVRKGLRVTLESEAKWTVVGEASSGGDAIELARKLKPDVVVIDLGMPELNGLEATRRIVRDLPSVRILVLTVYEAEHVINEVLEAGAHGYLLKSDAGRELIQAINALLQDKPYFTSKVARMILNGYLRGKGPAHGSRPPMSRLSDREREIVQLLAEGRTSKDVARQLNLSVKTAETHRANIMKKLGVHSVAELVRYAIRNQIIQA